MAGRYEHFIKPARLVNTDNLIRHLVTTKEDLEKVFNEHPVDKFPYIAYDTETNGLDVTISHVVGFSFAFNAFEGYYVPVRHIATNSNLEPKVAFDLLIERFKQSKWVFMYNARFDIRFTEREGYDLSKIKIIDVAIPVWYADSNTPMPGLKWAAEHFCGRKPSHFDETLGDAANFGYLQPEQGYQYAADDALNTFAVAQATMRFFKEGGFAAKLDNQVLYPIMKFEDMGIPINIKWLEHLLNVWEPKLQEYEENIYRSVGQRFNLNSGKQKEQILTSLGLHTGYYTASGAMKTDMDSLNELYWREKDKGNDYEFLNAMIKYAELYKLVNSYFRSLHDEAVRMNGRCRFSYLTTRVPTGRLACGSDKKNSYFAHLNVQAIPKPHPLDYYVHAKGVFELQYQYRGNELCLFNWVMTPTNEENPRKSHYITEGFSQDDNVRSAFVPEDGCLWVSIDYSAQELRVPAVLMGRGVWHDAFLAGKDVHKETAIAMWGAENYNKSMRKRAKGFNFGLQYGGTAWTILNNGMADTEDEAKELFERFEKSMSELRNWQKAYIKKAYQTGTVYSYFGFPRRVAYYLSSNDRKQISFGERTVMNHLVQSTSAQITKIALMKVWDKLCKPELNTGIKFMNTIHDEINLSIPYDKDNPQKFWEYLKIFRDCMVLQLPGWAFPLDVGVGIGIAQGNTVDFEMDEKYVREDNPQGWRPKWDEVVEEKPVEIKQEQKVEEPAKVEPKADELFSW